jgi:hypothetical protein
MSNHLPQFHQLALLLQDSILSPVCFGNHNPFQQDPCCGGLHSCGTVCPCFGTLQYHTESSMKALCQAASEGRFGITFCPQSADFASLFLLHCFLLQLRCRQVPSAPSQLCAPPFRGTCTSELSRFIMNRA